jgi:hypothetical protein
MVFGLSLKFQTEAEKYLNSTSNKKMKMKLFKQWGSITHKMALPISSISRCISKHFTKKFKEEGTSFSSG